MTLSSADRIVITDVINLHGHLCDAGAFDRMAEVFVDDVALDLSDFGAGIVVGLTTMRGAALALGDKNPVAHHVTNIILTQVDDDTVRAISKGIGIYTEGTSGSVIYDDTITREPQGWRIRQRTIRARRVPLRP